MFNLPTLDPLAAAGAPVTSTIMVVGAPLVLSVGLCLGISVAVLCVTVLYRRGTRRTLVSDAVPTARDAMPYATGRAR